MSAEVRDPILAGHTGPWTEEQWLSLPQDGVRIELLDGSLLVSPNPSPNHQRVSYKIMSLLEDAAEQNGSEIIEGVNVRLRSGRVLIPDLAVLYEETEDPIVDSRLVQMAIEIVSPNQEDRDRILKYDFYAASKIPWYLIVDAAKGHIGLSLNRLVDGRYEEVAKASNGEEFHLEPLDFTFDPAEILPRTLR